jgi:hypothetical protein
MKRQFTIAHLLAAALLGGVILGAIGFWEGSRVGMQQFLFADAKYRATILAFQLENLKRQNLAGLEGVMQIDLDHQLALHGEYLESHWKWLWPQPTPQPPDREIKHAVRFRLDNPYTEPDLSSPGSWKVGVDMDSPFIVDVIAGQRRNKELIAKVLATYGE